MGISARLAAPTARDPRNRDTTGLGASKQQRKALAVPWLSLYIGIDYATKQNGTSARAPYQTVSEQAGNLVVLRAGTSVRLCAFGGARDTDRYRAARCQ
jgi:hypothetical protein